MKLSTTGLDETLEAGGSKARSEAQRASGERWSGHDWHARTERVNGVVVLAAPPPTLKWWTVWFDQLGSHWYRGSDATEFDHEHNVATVPELRSNGPAGDRNQSESLSRCRAMGAVRRQTRSGLGVPAKQVTSEICEVSEARFIPSECGEPEISEVPNRSFIPTYP